MNGAEFGGGALLCPRLKWPLSNWTGKAVAGPRPELESILARAESEHSGVYFLIGTDPDTGKDAVYIETEQTK